MRNVVYTTALNAGFERLTCRLLGRGMLDPTEAEAEYMVERWRFGILRFMLNSEIAWVGEIIDIHYEYPDDPFNVGLCPTYIEAAGLYHVLTRRPADVPASYTGDDAAGSATQLIQDMVNTYGGPIHKIYNRLASTGINLGKISVSDHDTALDVIVNALKAGGTDGITYAMLVEEPEDGPALIPVGVGLADYQIPIRGLGLSRGWKGEEYAWLVRAAYTDGDGSSARSDPASDENYRALNNGVDAQRIISISGVGADAAKNGALSYLTAHGNPVAIAGNGLVKPSDGLAYGQLQTREGMYVPSWRGRAGRLIRLNGFRQHDASATTDNDRTFAIESTSYNVERGELTLTLDQRAIRSRLHEDPARIGVIRRAIEPGMSHNILLNTYLTFDTNVTITINTDTKVNTDPYTFSVPRNTKIHGEVDMLINDAGSSVADVRFQVGFAIDGVDWDNADEDHQSTDYINPGINGGTATVRGRPNPVSVPAGQHTIDFYIRDDAGAYEVVNVKFRLRG
jgi:hypothetical protein